MFTYSNPILCLMLAHIALCICAVYMLCVPYYRVGSKAAIGYSYGDSIAGDYNMSDNDSDVESIHEEEGMHVNVLCPVNAVHRIPRHEMIFYMLIGGSLTI